MEIGREGARHANGNELVAMGFMIGRSARACSVGRSVGVGDDSEDVFALNEECTKVGRRA